MLKIRAWLLLAALALPTIAPAPIAQATVTTSAASVTFAGNGATSVFTYAFIMPAAANAVVTYTNAAGSQTVIPSNQYTITGIGAPSGGTLTYPISGSPIAVGTRLTLQRIVPYTQPTTLLNQGAFNASTVMSMSDNLEYQIQQLAQGRSLMLQFPPVDSNSGLLVSAAQRANMILGFDALGNPIMLTPSGGGGVGGVSSVGLAMPAEFTVAGSPVTSTGTLTVTKAAQAANLVFAGPTSGGTAAPTFRALVAADIPAGIGTGTITGVTAGTGLTGGGVSGTVSLSLAAGAAATNLGYTPLRPSLNLSDVASAATSRANLSVCGKTGSFTIGHVATFADTGCTLQDGGTVGLGTITQVIAGTGLTGGGTSGPVTLNLQSPLTVPFGGVGASSLSAHGVLLGNGTGPVQITTTGTSGQVLTSNGAGVDPTFQSAVTGSVSSVSTGTGLTGGPITTSGTIAFAAIANNNLLANTGGGSAAPIATTASAYLDAALGSTAGNILYRGASVWGVLAPGSRYQMVRMGASSVPAWEDTPYDVAAFMPGVPAASAISRIILTRTVVLPISLTGSQCLAKTASSATATVTINKIHLGATTALGTAAFATSTGCSFTFSAAQTLPAGDIIEEVYPASPDATLADIAITLAGTRN